MPRPTGPIKPDVILTYDPVPNPESILKDLAYVLIGHGDDSHNQLIVQALRAAYLHTQYVLITDRTTEETALIKAMEVAIGNLIPGYIFGEVPGYQHYYGFQKESEEESNAQS